MTRARGRPAPLAESLWLIIITRVVVAKSRSTGGDSSTGAADWERNDESDPKPKCLVEKWKLMPLQKNPGWNFLIVHGENAF